MNDNTRLVKGSNKGTDKILIAPGISVTRWQYKTLQLTAEGYTLPYILEALNKDFGFLTVSKMDKFLTRFAEKIFTSSKIKLVNLKRTYNRNVRISIWFNGRYYENSNQVIHADIKVKIQHLADGSMIRTATSEYKVTRGFEAFTKNYRRPRSRAPYKVQPSFQISIKDLNSPELKREAYVEPGEMSDYLYTVRYIYPDKLLPGDHIRQKIVQNFSDWYSRTQKELNLNNKKLNEYLRKHPDENIPFSTKETRGHVVIWHEYNVRGIIDIDCTFSKEFPALWPELRIYSTSWTRDKALESIHLAQDSFTVNGKDRSKIGDDPVLKCRFQTVGLPICKVAFFWTPFKVR